MDNFHVRDRCEWLWTNTYFNPRTLPHLSPHASEFFRPEKLSFISCLHEFSTEGRDPNKTFQSTSSLQEGTIEALAQWEERFPWPKFVDSF